MEPQDMSVLFWDTMCGLYTHVAEALAPSFRQMLYWSEYRDAFPLHYRRYVGTGLPGIKRVDNPWLVIPDVDLVIFPDVGMGGETEFLRVHYGKLVWGTGLGEVLELNRRELLATQEELGLLTPDYRVIKGVDNLREFLKQHDDVYVKINTFRGDLETFHSITYDISRPKLDEFLGRISGIQEVVEFIVQFPLPGKEIGYDGSCIRGQYSQVALWGLEEKDKNYFAQVCDYADLPECLRYINEVFSPIFEELDVRGFLSTEVRQNTPKQFALIDPCMRAGSPPSEAYMSLYENWPEHIAAGAQGDVVDLDPNAQFVVQIMLYSDFIMRNKWLSVYFPEEFRSQVMLHGHMIQADVDYCVSTSPENPIFGAAVGKGQTLKAAIANCLEIAKSIQTVELDIDEAAFDNVDKTIVGLRQHGINW